MSDGCYSHVEFVMKEEQRDYELNPSLMVACVGIITKLCPPETETNVIECLEEKFLQEKIGDHACMIVSRNAVDFQIISFWCKDKVGEKVAS